MSLVKKMYKGVGLVSEWSGRVIMFVTAILVVTICYDVFMRYALNAPTNWSYILSYMLGSSIVAIGLPYVYYHNANVRIDVIYSRVSPKLKLIIDISLTLLFFFPVVFILTTTFGQDTWYAYQIKEVAWESVWYPVLWPFKLVMTLGFGLLFLQGIATFVKDIMSLTKGGKEPW